MPTEQPGGTPESAEHSFIHPKPLQWHMGSWVSQKNAHIDARTRRSYMPGMSTMYVSTEDLSHRVRDSLQPNVHRAVAEYFGTDRKPHDLRFLDADPGDGLLASALQKQFGDMRVVGMKKGVEKTRLDSHLPPNARHVQQNILEYVNFTSSKEFTPDCIHLGHLPADTRHAARVLQWAIEAVSDEGMVLVTLDDEDTKDACSQAGWRHMCGMGPAGSVPGIEGWAKRQQVGVESCVVSLEVLLDNSPDGKLALQELLYSELPVEKRIKADPHLAKYVEQLQNDGGIFRHNTRLMALYANPDRAGATPAPAAGAADETARLMSGIGAVQTSVKTVVTASPKPVDAFEEAFKRWWAQINSKHERRFYQFTRDWKTGDSAKKAEKEAAIRAELKECGVPRGEVEQYFKAIMAFFGANNPAPGVPVNTSEMPISAPAPGAVAESTALSPLPLRSATAAQVLERMEYIDEQVHGNESGPEFEGLLQQSGWPPDVWRLLRNESGKLSRAPADMIALDVLNRRGASRPVAPAPAQPKPAVPQVPAKRLDWNVPVSPADAARLQAIPATTFPGLRSAPLASQTAEPTPNAAPVASADTPATPEVDDIGLAKMPPAARAEAQALARAYRTLRGAGHHHLTAGELQAAGKLVHCLREYGYNFSDVEALIQLSSHLQQRAMESVAAHTPTEAQAFEKLQTELASLLPAKGALRVDLRGDTRSKFAAFLRLWRKLHGTYVSLADAVPFAIPSPAALAIINGEFRTHVTRDLAPDAFPKEESQAASADRDSPPDAPAPIPANSPAQIPEPTPAPAADAPARPAESVSPPTNVDIPENVRTQVEEMMQSSLQRIPAKHRDTVQRNFELLLARPRTKEATPEYVRRAIVELVPVLQEYGYTKGMLMNVIKMASITMDKMLEDVSFLSEAEQAALARVEASLLGIMPPKGTAQPVHFPEAARPLLATYVRLRHKQGKKFTDIQIQASFALPAGNVLAVIESGFVGKTTAEISPELFGPVEGLKADDSQSTVAVSPLPVERVSVPAEEDVSLSGDVPLTQPVAAIVVTPEPIEAAPVEPVTEKVETAPPAELPTEPEIPLAESEPQEPPVAAETAEAPKQTEEMVPVSVVRKLEGDIEQQRLQIGELMAQVAALQQAPKAAAPDVQKTRVVINHPNGTQSVLTIEGNAPAVLFLPPETEARGTLDQ